MVLNTEFKKVLPTSQLSHDSQSQEFNVTEERLTDELLKLKVITWSTIAKLCFFLISLQSNQSANTESFLRWMRCALFARAVGLTREGRGWTWSHACDSKCSQGIHMTKSFHRSGEHLVGWCYYHIDNIQTLA